MSEPIAVRVVLTTPAGELAELAWAADSTTLILETAGLALDPAALRPSDVRAATPAGELVTAERLRAATAPDSGQQILVIGFGADRLGVPADVQLPEHLLPLKYPEGPGQGEPAAPLGWLCKIYDFEWCD